MTRSLPTLHFAMIAVVSSLLGASASSDGRKLRGACHTSIASGMSFVEEFEPSDSNEGCAYYAIPSKRSNSIDITVECARGNVIQGLFCFARSVNGRAVSALSGRGLVPSHPGLCDGMAVVHEKPLKTTEVEMSLRKDGIASVECALVWHYGVKWFWESWVLKLAEERGPGPDAPTGELDSFAASSSEPRPSGPGLPGSNSPSLSSPGPFASPSPTPTQEASPHNHHNLANTSGSQGKQPNTANSDPGFDQTKEVQSFESFFDMMENKGEGWRLQHNSLWLATLLCVVAVVIGMI